MSTNTVNRLLSPEVYASLQIIFMVIALGNYVGWMAGVVGFESAVMSIALMATALALRVD